MSTLRRLLLRLYPNFGHVRKCQLCGRVAFKDEMYYLGGYGWFCSKEEADEFWGLHQI